MKDQFFERFPNLVLTDAIGSSEGGSNGYTIVAEGQHRDEGRARPSRRSRDTVVLDEDLRAGRAGLGRRRQGRPQRATSRSSTTRTRRRRRETFVTAPDGTRYSIPGDFATVEADGTITLLGRGSVSINSGGEKIFPEEVEAAVKSHPDVYDAVVVGVPDERWGQRVAAVVQPREGATPTLDDVQEHCRTKIAGLQGAARAAPRRRGRSARPAASPTTAGPRRSPTGSGGQGMKTRACDMFGIDLPIFAFSHCRDVVAAVSKAGGLGVLGALAFSPEQLEIELELDRRARRRQALRRRRRDAGEATRARGELDPDAHGASSSPR